MKEIEDLEFLDKMSTEKKLKAGQDSGGRGLECAPASNNFNTTGLKDNADFAVNVRRWSKRGEYYFPAHETVEALEPGFYNFTEMPNIGTCLEKTTVPVDNLIRLPDDHTAKILEEFNAFWTLKQKFTSRGFLHKRGIMLWGPPGCLDAETKIHYQAFHNDGRRSHQKTVTIERLYQLFHRIIGKGKGRYQTLPVETEMRVSSVNDDGCIISNKIINVVKSGIKKVYKLTTDSGSKILITKDHKFLTNGKYIPLENLKINDSVDMHKNTAANVSKSGTKTGRIFCYVKQHPFARTKIVNKYTYKVLPNARVVVEANMNGLTRNDYLLCLNEGNIEGLSFLDNKYDVHHIDEDCTNDDLKNLEILTHSDHASLHGSKNPDLFFVTTSETITSIEYIGERETYDIQMAAPYHNFVANQFVVHNSGKTASIMLMAKDIIEKYSGIVCKIEHPNLAAEGVSMIRKIEPERPIVALMEDLDALIDTYGENRYLALLDGETQVDNILYIATTNYPELLDRRFVDRPSRFDTIKKIGMPSAEARKMYLETKEPDLTEKELKEWVSRTDGFSVAHLRELIIAVKCFEYSLDDTIERLDKMRVRKPSSEDGDEKEAFGFTKK